VEAVTAEALPAQGSTQRPMAVARIRLPLSTCYRYPGLRKADACEWLFPTSAYRWSLGFFSAFIRAPH
jgi:hypothetical protein